MTKSLYKGLQCSKSQEEVEQSYSEDSYKEIQLNHSDFTVTWNGVDISDGMGETCFLYILPPEVVEVVDENLPTCGVNNE